MSNARTCGNCRTSVNADATFCPACGALLSAYESPAGATATATADLTIPPVPTTSVAPVTTPAPTAPTPAPWAIRTTTTSRPASFPTTPAPLATDPAVDDLAAMAAPSDFAQSIEADLADVKVVFDDKAHAVIETAPTAPDLDLTAGEPIPTTSPDAAGLRPWPPAATPRTTTTRAPRTTRPPRTTTTRTPRTTTTRMPRTTTTRAPRPGAARTEFTTVELEPQTTRPPWNPDPARELHPPVPPARESWRSTPARSASDAPKKTPFMQSKYLIPTIVVGLIVINIAVRNPGFGLFVIIAAILVFFLMRGAIGASKANSRTTTRMPKDTTKQQ